MVFKKPNILIVDDDRSICEILVNILEYAGYCTDVAHDGKTALSKIKNNNLDLVLLDLKLPEMNGMKVLERAMKVKPSVQVVMISGQGTIHTAVEATKIGAFDFLEKPLDSERVLLTLKNAMGKRRLEIEKANLLDSVKKHYKMVGESPGMKHLSELIRKASETNSKVLIEGENGTGKELVARAIHNNSKRVGSPFVAVNCAAIQDTLIESELFGYKKGAFTGAVTDKPGRFQVAEGGTLLLDEVGDMSLMTQSKLLRTLEEGTIEMVGSTEPIPVDVRVIAATNKNLIDRIKNESFREDLYFRLNVINIKVPPLRERKVDIPLLVEHFVHFFCNEHGIVRKKISPRAMNQLMMYSWPGNVRELKNVIEKLVVLVESNEIQPQEIFSFIQNYSKFRAELTTALSLKQAKEEFERGFITEKLIDCNWNITKTAAVLNIPRTYLHRKIKSLGINV